VISRNLRRCPRLFAFGVGRLVGLGLIVVLLPLSALGTARGQAAPRRQAVLRAPRSDDEMPPPPPPAPEPVSSVRALPRSEPSRVPSPAAPVQGPGVQAYAGMSSRARRELMYAQGVPYSTTTAAKQALYAGEIDDGFYRDVIWALRKRRNDRVDAEKQVYKRGAIGRAEYERRVQVIDAEFEGEPVTPPPPAARVPASAPLPTSAGVAPAAAPPAFPNIAAAKRAYQAGQIGNYAYRDAVGALKRERSERIQAEKLLYKRGAISRDEYDRRVRVIELQINGD